MVSTRTKSTSTSPSKEGLDIVEVPVQQDHAHKKKPQTSKKKEALWTRDFIVISLVNLLLVCGFQFFLPTLPLYLKELGAADAILGWVTGITTIAALLIRPFSGMIVDRFGRKGILLFSLFLMAGISFSYAFFPLIGAVLAIRFFHGIGWGLASTGTSTIATDVISRKRFGEGIGYFGLSASLGMAIAPGIGISLFYSAGMTTISYVATAVLLCSMVLTLVVRDQPSEERAVKTAEEHMGWKSRMFEKNAIFPSFLMAFISATYGAVITFAAVFAEAQGIAESGLFFTVYASILLLTRPLVGRLVDARGAQAVIFPGLVALVIGLILISFTDSLPLFLVCAVVYGFGVGTTQTGLQTLALGLAPANRRGAANATFFIGFDGGLGIGSVASGIIVAAVGYSAMYLIFAILPVIAGLIFALHRLRKERYNH